MPKRILKYALLSFAVLAIVLIVIYSIGTMGVTDTASSDADGAASIDESGDSAVVEGLDFAITGFTRAQVGSNRNIGGTYHGYAYLTGSDPDKFSAVFVNMESDDPYAVLYMPQSASGFGILSSADALASFEDLLWQIDEYNANGGVTLPPDQIAWHVTDQQTYEVDGIVYSFAQELKEGSFYTVVRGADGSDATATDNPIAVKLGHCSYGYVSDASAVTISGQATGWEAVGEFFAELDWSPLLITLRTTLVSLVFIFVLGLLAAYWVLTLTPKVRNVMDAVFTIPMVLPPTICGFLLLMVLGRNSPVGQWFIDVGFPLAFSWQATVIASTVVAFPLMYMNAKGAFEGLDSNMLDAARTLGWSNFKIFRKLMLPLSWTSIAAGTALSFARAAGEFGATLFLAGNYAGITQTIPIAIYFQWMNGRTDIAMFWTLVIIIVSFAVIVFINVFTGRTTKYRRRDSDES